MATMEIFNDRDNGRGLEMVTAMAAAGMCHFIMAATVEFRFSMVILEIFNACDHNHRVEMLTGMAAARICKF